MLCSTLASLSNGRLGMLRQSTALVRVQAGSNGTFHSSEPSPSTPLDPFALEPAAPLHADDEGLGADRLMTSICVLMADQLVASRQRVVVLGPLM